MATGSKGLRAQRNRGIARAAAHCGFQVFFDDDFVPSRFALEGVTRCFHANPDVAGITGVVLADGITGPGISGAEAERIVAAYGAERAGPDAGVLRERPSLYGCNMAFRQGMVEGMVFEERLPLYGWQEDVDVSMRARARGRMVVAAGFVGVHCGVKAGREKRGQRLGYSQIANPIYLVRKGVMPRREAARLCLRNLLANHGKLLTPEPRVDRRGRTLGNWKALRDWTAGRLHPERIMEICPPFSRIAGSRRRDQDEPKPVAERLDAIAERCARSVVAGGFPGREPSSVTPFSQARRSRSRETDALHGSTRTAL
ncbi:hypothetical protein [Rubrimonas cliftonensis]|uniref:Glycosyl transferase family 2 n=1 Tax=Rubrimonas cliftonensis TaxID=89524 RepID=A0A1H4E7E1_9RHOB|nr:hypothetical protein [Rubrimonas cliftonensis]SEA80719.1 hypothetical protein SAMN05444370_11280 [Rubrimonas cliftonensis]